ncbi:MAG TPA: response regulator transcription factor [Acidimicrobiales bacterium]|nr:response regulator transcription factor [Acidimicrobiales bacterium]
MSETSAVLRAVIASDNFLTREGLACLLNGVPSIEVVARVDSHPDTLDAVRRYRPDVLIVGIRTPRVNAEAALSAAQRLRSEYPSIGVVVIAEAGDGYAFELLRSGAAHVGYLLDDRVGDLETLVSAVHGAHAGDTVLDPSIVNALVRRRLPSALDVLSIRELDVLTEMADGYANNEIARHLAVSEKAVERHVTGIFRKLRVPESKRFDRRVTAVLAYLHAIGELSTKIELPQSGDGQPGR